MTFDPHKVDFDNEAFASHALDPDAEEFPRSGDRHAPHQKRRHSSSRRRNRISRRMEGVSGFSFRRNKHYGC